MCIRTPPVSCLPVYRGGDTGNAGPFVRENGAVNCLSVTVQLRLSCEIRPARCACFAVFAISRAISVFFAPISGRRLVKRITGGGIQKRREREREIRARIYKNISRISRATTTTGKVISNDPDLGIGKLFENAVPFLYKNGKFRLEGKFRGDARKNNRTRKVPAEIRITCSESRSYRFLFVKRGKIRKREEGEKKSNRVSLVLGGEESPSLKYSFRFGTLRDAAIAGKQRGKARTDAGKETNDLSEPTDDNDDDDKASLVVIALLSLSLFLSSWN